MSVPIVGVKLDIVSQKANCSILVAGSIVGTQCVVNGVELLRQPGLGFRFVTASY